MGKIRLISVLLALLSALIATYSFYQSTLVYHSNEKEISGSIELASINKEIQNAGRDINKGVQNIGRELEVLAASDSVGDKEKAYLNEELSAIRREIERIQNTEVEIPAPVQVEEKSEKDPIVLWAKLGFSLLFGLSALFVVLSKKYKEDTEKWAFSVLSLISGVWIGTIS